MTWADDPDLSVALTRSMATLRCPGNGNCYLSVEMAIFLRLLISVFRCGFPDAGCRIVGQVYIYIYIYARRRLARAEWGLWQLDSGESGD